MEIGCGGEQSVNDFAREIKEIGCGQHSVISVSHDSALKIMEVRCACGQQSVTYFSQEIVTEIGCGGVEQFVNDFARKLWESQYGGGKQSGNDSPQEIVEIGCGGGEQSVNDFAREIVEIGCSCGEQSGNDSPQEIVMGIGCGGEQSGNDFLEEIVEIGCGGGQQSVNYIRKLARSVNYIPEEVVEEIFANLPAKSLMRFRCVSKSWLYLIGNKRFINKHLENSKRRGVAIVNENCSIIGHVNCFNISRYPFSKAFDPLEGGWIIGCCNGVQCILNWGHFFLLNPATRTSVTLPLFDFVTVTQYGYFEVRCGFGWDEESDAYKVFVCNHNIKGVTYGKVYSSKTNSWKKVDCGRLCYCGSPDHANVGVLLSGKIHWVPEREGEDDWIYADFIEYFDLKSEVFGRIKLPSEPEGGVGRWWLIERDGCLNAFYNHNDDDKGKRRVTIKARSLALQFESPDRETLLERLPPLGKDEEVFDVWVMEEYGVEESWVKKSTNIPFLKSALEYQQYVYVESLISPTA